MDKNRGCVKSVNGYRLESQINCIAGAIEHGIGQADLFDLSAAAAVGVSTAVRTKSRGGFDQGMLVIQD